MKFLKVLFFQDLFEALFDFVDMFSQISSPYLQEFLAPCISTAKSMWQENTVFIHPTTLKRLHQADHKKK